MKIGKSCRKSKLNDLKTDFMSFHIDVYYAPPKNNIREDRISKIAGSAGGRLENWEESSLEVSHAICLTYDFADLSNAEQAAARLRQIGEHVEGPADYGDG